MKSKQQPITFFFLSGWMALAPLLGSSYLAIELYQHHETLADASLVFWVLLSILSVFTMAFAFTPTTLISLVSGYFLGWKALLLVIPAYLLAAVIGYFVSRSTGKQFQEWLQKRYPKSQALFTGVQQSPLELVFWGRISPFLPFAIMNVFLPALGVPFRSFILGSLVGMLPRTCWAIYAGGLAGQLRDLVMEGPQSDSWNLYIQLFLIIISLIGLSLYFRRVLKKAKI